MYTSTANTRAGARKELKQLVLSGLPVQEFTVLGTVIFQSNGNYTNTPRARTIEAQDDVGDTVDYYDWRVPSGVPLY